MWCEINFKLEPEVEATLFGHSGRTQQAFRKKLAALDTKYQMNLGHEFFGYSAEGGTKDRGETTIGIGCNQTGLKLVGIGPSACALLSKKAPAIHSALITEANGMIGMNIRSGEHEASFVPYEKRMVIRRLCVGHSVAGNFWFGASDLVNQGATWLEVADRKIPHTIGRGLLRQAIFLNNEGDDLEGNVGSMLAPALAGDKPWPEAGREFGDRLGIKLLGVKGHSYLRVAKTRSLVMLHDVEFTMRGEFSGLWMIGRLKIEAQGILVNATRQIAETVVTA